MDPKAALGSSDVELLERALECWLRRRSEAFSAAAVYLEDGDQGLRRISCHGTAAELVEGFPELLPASTAGEVEPSLPGCRRLALGGGWLLCRDEAGPVEEDTPWSEPLESSGNVEDLLLLAAVRACELSERLRLQTFQNQYRGVELEALYDVGLAVVSTLDLPQLTEEILLRAVSLLDARRGVLYEHDGGVYRRRRMVGGSAPELLEIGDEGPQGLLEGDEALLRDLLPGAEHVLAVTVEAAGSPRGLLVVADKESRFGVGPFTAPDRRTLSLFAHQAGIALENAHLHRQALEKERLEREMELAAQIQRQLLPESMPRVAGWELHGWNRPARQVGGDYYGVMERPGGRLLTVVADVSGKGMPAALLVSNLHSALDLLLGPEGLLDQEDLLVDEVVGTHLLHRLNRHVLDSSLPNKFITLLLVELDLATGRARYLNAGHNPALLLSVDGSLRYLEASGPPVGLLPEATYRVDTVTLHPGDLLCLYSDGITECTNLQGVELGEEQLLELLRRHAAEPLPQLAGRLDAACRRFARGLAQGDDQTLLLVRRGLEAAARGAPKA
ncbi:MAG: SpoIIE family protein phosphatase [Acidobacteriota bacterium]|nr:SpoIIE family protein phosphatase [Acidobacteriota bacterium]